MSAETGVYRAPMRSRDDDVEAGAAVERALALGVCGMGGRLAHPPSGLQTALRELDRRYDERTAHRVERFAAVPSASLVWTRRPDGAVFLGRLTGEWWYDETAEARAVDLVHVRDCTWLPDPVADHDVPPAVTLTFDRGGRNFQRIHHPDVSAQSLHLWRSGTDGGAIH